MKNFIVGQRYSQFQMVDGAQMIIDDGGITVFITMSGITKKEEETTRGNFTYYLTVYNNILFLSLDFGSLSFDMGLNRARVMTPLPRIDVDDDVSGYAMTIVVADGVTGEIKSIRLIGLSNKFSKRLYKTLEEQEPFSTLEEEMSVIRAIQAEKTTKEIISESVVYGKSART